MMMPSIKEAIAIMARREEPRTGDFYTQNASKLYLSKEPIPSQKP
jgi:hypothetical protein